VNFLIENKVVVFLICEKTEIGHSLRHPQDVCLLSKFGHGTVVIKNCNLFVFGKFWFAIDTVKGMS